jgi:hypothetical protein
VTTDKGYEFTTFRQVIYQIYFTDVTPTFPGVSVKVLSFGFDCIGIPKHFNIGSLPPDSRVGETIAAVLDDFFSRHTDVIVYVPMHTDGKAELRLRLFDFWWHRYRHRMNCQDVEKDKYIFSYSDDEFIATMLYRVEVRSEIQKIIFGLESFNEEK